MPPLPKIQNKDQLFQAYVTDKMSINQIVLNSQELLGIKVSNASVYNALNRMGIKTRSISESVSRSKSQLNIDKTFMTDQILEWTDGFLLGDGRISYKLECNDEDKAYKNARFAVGVLYKEFAVYAMSGFKDYHPSEPKQSGTICKRRPHLMWSSSTLSHPDIFQQAKRWYRGQGKKTRVPSDVCLTPTSILLWYLGDGSICCTSKRNFVMLRLATCSFSIQDIEEILIPKLKALGINCVREKSKNDIRICPDSIGRFFNFIGRKSPIQCYDYKFDVPDWLFKTRLIDIMNYPRTKDPWVSCFTDLTCSERACTF
jgi:hypothetical protein